VIAVTLLAGAFIGSARAAGMTWAAAQLVDHQPPFATAPMIHAVSCPSARLCVGVEDSGVVTSTRPTTGAAAWTATSFLGTRGYSGAVLGSVSCASSHLCVVADLVGDIFTSTNPTGGRAAWKHVRSRTSLWALSCPTRKLCVGVSGGEIVTSTNPTGGASAWRSFPVGQSFEDLDSIACASPRLCVAAGTNDDAPDIVSSTNPTGGSRAWKLTELGGAYLNFAFSGVSCPAVRLCVITDADGDVVSSTHPARRGAWKVSRVAGVERTVSCPSVRLCVSLSPGAVVTSTHPAGGARAWHAVPLTEPLTGVVTVSCGSVSACVAVDWGEHVLTSTAPTRGGAAWARVDLGHGSNALEGVSCPTPSLCVAVDDAGNVVSSPDPFDPAPTWSVTHVGAGAPMGWPTYAHGFSSVSCPSATFCAAASVSDVLISGDPAGGATSWTTLHVLGGAALTQISCPSESLCVAGDSIGDVVASSDPQAGAGAWHPSLIGEPPSCDKYDCYYDSIISVSCASDHFCAATDGAELWVSTDPTGGAGAWRRTTLPSSGSRLSCPTASLCVLASAGSIEATADPASPSPHWIATPLPATPTRITPLISDLSCTTSLLCIAVDSAGGYAFAGDPTGGAGAWTIAKIDFQAGSGVLPQPSSLDAVSCQPGGLCVAVDGLGRVLTGRATG
jgi:hypothetical protein